MKTEYSSGGEVEHEVGIKSILRSSVSPLFSADFHDRWNSFFHC